MPTSLPFFLLTWGEAPLFSRPLGLVFPPSPIPFPSLRGTGREALAAFAALGRAFLLVSSRSVLRFAGRGVCLQFRLSFPLNGTSCAAKQGETYQQPAGPVKARAARLPQPTLSCISIRTPRTISIFWSLSDIGLLLRRTMIRHMLCSRTRKILNVFQRIRLRFFVPCGLASARPRSPRFER